MNVLITAGGTSENIDNVRSIKNKATGRLGSLIAGEFYACGEIEKLYYICGQDSVAPKLPNTEIIRVGGVAELKTAVETVLRANRIDIAVHSMAVSDYTVSGAVSADTLSEVIAERICDGTLPEKDKIVTIIKETLEQGDFEAGRNGGKISSDLERLILTLKQTPKVIGIFKELRPEAVLVGFKLLDGVAQEDLIDTAYRLLQKNGCDFVLANDSQSFMDGGHTGYLISPDKSYIRLNGKENIARGIVMAVIKFINGGKGI